MKSPRFALLPALALVLGAAACAPVPAAPYYTVPPPGVVSVPQTYRNDSLGGGFVPQSTAAVGVDSYCREAYANAAGTQQAASMTGTYADAARAERSAGFFRRDC